MTTENLMESGPVAGQGVWSNIKSRFVIVIILSILISSALSSIYGVDGTPASLAYLAILTPVFFILSYTLFEIFKHKLTASSLNTISIELLAGITSFVFPLIFVALYKSSTITLGIIMKLVLAIAVWCVPLVALITFLTILGAGLMSLQKK